MSHRPTTAKKIKGLRRALHNNAGAPPTYMDLVQWLKDHKYAQTSKQAEAIILAGRVKYESHTVGTLKLFDPLKNENRLVVQRYIPANQRTALRVEAAAA
jgi:hypothetical protein